MLNGIVESMFIDCVVDVWAMLAIVERVQQSKTNPTSASLITKLIESLWKGGDHVTIDILKVTYHHCLIHTMNTATSTNFP